jgi:hypothetical protein
MNLTRRVSIAGGPVPNINLVSAIEAMLPFILHFRPRFWQRHSSTRKKPLRMHYPNPIQQLYLQKLINLLQALLSDSCRRSSQALQVLFLAHSPHNLHQASLKTLHPLQVLPDVYSFGSSMIIHASSFPRTSYSGPVSNHVDFWCV